jgi:rhodanese-related sulfurtransferase
MMGVIKLRSKATLVILCISFFFHSGIVAAGTESAKKSNLAIPEKLIIGNTIRHDPDLFVFPEKVIRDMKGNTALFLIDVRNKAKFDQFRIPGSINIPLYAIKTKAALRTGSLVLINEGHSYGQLERTCRQLREAGFKASVLAGGLNRWRQVGGRLEGDPFAKKELNKVMPQAWFQEKKYANWVVIDVTENGSGKELIPWSVPVPSMNDPAQFSARLTEVIAGSGKDPLLSVLIVSQEGAEYGRIEKATEKSGIKNLFFLKGGLKGYRRYLEDQVLMGQGAKKRKIGVKGCSSCP